MCQRFFNLQYWRIKSITYVLVHVTVFHVYSVDEQRPSTELLSDTTAVVSFKGDVTWSMPAIIKSACRVNIADYPFDVQRCPLKFGSWTYNGFELNLTNFADTAMLDNYEGSGEWNLIGVPCERHEVSINWVNEFCKYTLHPPTHIHIS